MGDNNQQKFSIEDFKLLDKRKLLNQRDHYDDEEEVDIDEIEVEEKQLTEEEHKSYSQDDGDKWSHDITRPPNSDREIVTQESEPNLLLL